MDVKHDHDNYHHHKCKKRESCGEKKIQKEIKVNEIQDIFMELMEKTELIVQKVNEDYLKFLVLKILLQMYRQVYIYMYTYTDYNQVAFYNLGAFRC